MRGPNPSAVVVALSTVVAVSTAGFMVSVLGGAGGASATLPIPGITGSAAPVADEVPGPPPVEVGPGASEDAPSAGDAPADPQAPNANSGGNQSQTGAGSSEQPGGTDATDETVAEAEPAPTPVPPVPATPITPPKPTSPPSGDNGKPDHANPGNGTGTNGQSNTP